TVAKADEAASCLIITGSTVASGYRLPRGVDLVKVPALTKTGPGAYEALRLRVAVDPVHELRGAIAAAAAFAFRPNVFVVDKTPIGLRGELLTALEALRSRGGCRVVLGLRDVEDSAATVRREWGDGGLSRAVDRFYDQIIVYGPPAELDALAILGWQGLKTDYVGYVAGEMPSIGPADLPPGYLLATVGGGNDGFELLSTLATALRRTPIDVPTVMVAGPLMADDQRRRLEELTRGQDVHVIDFRPDMASVLAGARAVVSMAGYNTVAEILSARKPALLVPRVHPREEQLIRARDLAERGLAAFLDPRAMTPAALATEVGRLLRIPRPPLVACTDGAQLAATIILGLADRRRSPTDSLQPRHLSLAGDAA
ncbi:MAG: glycosyltransferase family protein, partial [Gaiellales bacterium]